MNETFSLLYIRIYNKKEKIFFLTKKRLYSNEIILTSYTRHHV